MPSGFSPKRTALSAAVAAALAAYPALAQEQKPKRKLEEITVTATKVEQSLQDVPISVTAIGADAIEDLGITNFADYVLQLPTVTAGGSGPGQNTIYIRGIASTTPNLTTAGVAGLTPNVAFYLDEQPLAQPGRNLDVYAADLERIEVLSGPQGTLFGSSSQAGNVRLITNKPEFGEFYGRVNVGAGSISDGGALGNVELMLNMPFSDTFAARAVLYTDTKEGWIDNVSGTRTAASSARFRDAGTVRANGVPVSSNRQGFQSSTAVPGIDYSGITFLEATNEDLVEEDFNETTYTGGRVSFRWDVSERLRLDLQHTSQDLDSDGVFFADPNLGDLEVQRFSPDTLEDSFSNTAWTATALFGELEVLYTGAFTDRDTDQVVDYTDYLFVGQYLPYYICDGSVTYPGVATNPTGTCNSPNLFVDSRSQLESITHELRFTTDQSKALRFTGGVFYQDLELKELNDFTYPGSVDAVAFNGETGFAPNYPLTNTEVTGIINNAFPGYFSEPGPFPEGVIFRNDVLRTDEQLGVFGEFTYDINEKFAVTVGGRWYDIEVDFEGSANGSFFNFGQTEDAQAFGTNISAQYAPDNPNGNPDTASADGTIFKITGTWRPNVDQMWYATLSEGFRPGLLNRPGGASGPGGYTVPFALETDDVTNFEIGTKSMFFDSTFQLNASAFFVDIERLQTTIFDPSIVNLFFSDNAANAEVMGVEGDFTWLPGWSERWTFTGAFSFLDTEITDVLLPTDDVQAGSELAFAPEFQGTLRARYEWPMGRLMAHVMPMVSWASESFSDVIVINRDEIDSWAMASVTAGLSADTWSAELFINNITDERAEVARNFVFDRTQVTYAQPLTVGVRASFNF